MSTNGVEDRPEKRKADDISTDTVVISLNELKDVADKACECHAQLRSG